ncbi:hypothetical protein, partial [Longimicrobium sp.]|uniref:hypothetical protein n=1 Tax=Longimicrobium sp. TaxID=2029185 RepID=UPI002F937E43
MADPRLNLREIVRSDGEKGVRAPLLNTGVAGACDAAAFRDAFGLTLDGVSNDGPGLALLAAHVADEGIGRIRLADPLRVNASMTLAASLEVRPGALLRPGPNVTITLAGSVEAGNFRWIDESLGGKVRFAPDSVEYLNPVHWGAPVNDKDDDGPYIRAAGLNAMTTGIPVRLISGYWTVGSGDTSKLVWLDGATHDVTIIGAGVGVTNIKRPDNSIPDPGVDPVTGVQRRSQSLRLFYVRPAPGSEIRVSISGMSIDDNHRGNPFFAADPLGEKRQATHCIQVVAQGSRGVTELRAENLSFHDCNADGLSLGTNLDSAFGDIFLSGIRESGRARKLRAGICVTGMFRNIVLSNVVVNNLECELNQRSDYPCHARFVNVDVDFKLDWNPKKTLDTGVLPKLLCVNLTATGRVNTGQCEAQFVNCSFSINEPWRIQEYNYSFTGSCRINVRYDFHIPAGTSPGGVVYVLGSTAPDNLSLDGVTFTHDKYNESNVAVVATIPNPLPVQPTIPAGSNLIPVGSVLSEIASGTVLTFQASGTTATTRAEVSVGATTIPVYGTAAAIQAGDAIIRPDTSTVAHVQNPLPVPSSVPAGAVTVPALPLPGALPAGQVLKYGTGVYVTLAAPAAANATSLTTEPVPFPIYPGNNAIAVTLFDPVAAGITCYLETS